MRNPGVVDLEWRQRMAQIRTAARKGANPAEIAESCGLPLAAVKRVLDSAHHPRVSDPAQLIQNRKAASGMAPADVQLYWLGFLTAAGHIRGQGASFTLVVTLGRNSRTHVETLMADLATDHVRCEFCHSSIVGWQVYLRDQNLCNALVPWGVPSDLYGDDPELLNDLPKELALPFLRGYADGNWPSAGSTDTKFTLHGTPSVLAGINSMLKRYCEATGGVVTRKAERAELRFSSARASRSIRTQLNAIPPRRAAGE